MARLANLAWLPWLALSAIGCAAGTGPSFDAIPPQRVEVNHTLRVPLTVRSYDGPLRLRFVGPDLAGLADTTSIAAGSGGGGEFRWTPLASHVGAHEFVFIAATTGDDEIARTAALVTVEPAAGEQPVFLRPGAGGTFDPSQEPCIEVLIEVRDDDSGMVDIRARTALPEGATLTREGAKRAVLRWCPSPEQLGTSDRWTVELEADDGDHPPVAHSYVIVFRETGNPACPGDPPFVAVRWPIEGQRLVTRREPGAPAFVTVMVDAADDGGLAGPPVVHYGFERPAEPIDIATLEHLQLVAQGDGFVGRIDMDDLTYRQERPLFLVAAATDDNDPTGTSCDLLTVTELRTATVVGGGIVSCLDDRGEEDDTTAEARPLTGTAFFGTICSGDEDHIAFYVAETSDVNIELIYEHSDTTDLNMRLYGPSGQTLPGSFGDTGIEHIPSSGNLSLDPGTYTVRIYGTGAGDYAGEVILR